MQTLTLLLQPGCYFNESLLEPAFENAEQQQQQKYLNKEALQKFMVSMSTVQP